MAGIIRATETIDTYNRVTLPKDWCKKGDVVYFELTKSGNLIIHKMKTEEVNNEVSNENI